MAETAGWQFMKDWIKNKIKKTDTLSVIKKDNAETIANDVLTAQSRLDVYKAVLNWVEDKVRSKKKYWIKKTSCKKAS